MRSGLSSVPRGVIGLLQPPPCGVVEAKRGAASPAEAISSAPVGQGGILISIPCDNSECIAPPTPIPAGPAMIGPAAINGPRPGIANAPIPTRRPSVPPMAPPYTQDFRGDSLRSPGVLLVCEVFDPGATGAQHRSAPPSRHRTGGTFIEHESRQRSFPLVRFAPRSRGAPDQAASGPANGRMWSR
jgi:hypothetical protein